jgi:cytochrome c biogenesis protein CcmG, thiol:disulfide interchange protein DsbE
MIINLPKKRKEVMSRILVIALLLISAAVWSQDLKKAPSFSLENAEGKQISLDSILVKGPVLLNFWASWCKPCKEELPEFNKIKNDYSSKGLNVVLVTIDKPASFTKAKSFLRTKGFELELLKDCDQKVIKSFGGGESVPYTFLIDTEKNITFRKKGQTSYNELLKEVKKVIK